MEFDPEQKQKFERMIAERILEASMDSFENEEAARNFVNWCLSGSYTDEGIEKWWQRPRSQLGNQTPEQAWPVVPEKVIGLAAWLVYPGPTT